MSSVASNTSNGLLGDPKFWPKAIKIGVLANICFFIFLGNMYSAGLATGFVPLAMEFRVGFGKLADLISYSVLALGLANIFWMPTALVFGKRLVVIVTLTGFLACSIWSTKAKSFNSLLASRILASFFAGSVESIGPSMIADMYFEKEFATAMAVFAFFLSAGSQIGPLIAGYLIQSKGWRWHFILCDILLGINLLFTIFFLLETSYTRDFHDGQTAAEADKEIVEHLEHDNVDAKNATEVTGHNVTFDQDLYKKNYVKSLFTIRHPGLLPGGLKTWAYQFVLPLPYIFVPITFYASATYGVMLGGVVLISTIAPNIFSPPPYLFSSADLGLFSVASFIGIVIVMPIAGPATDYLSARLNRRNHGIHKPEYRLPALVIPFAIAPVGLIVFAWTVTNGESYTHPAAGYAMQSSALVLVSSVVLSYTVDSYPRTGSEALVLINAAKNVIAFAITTNANQWLAGSGLRKMFAELAGIQWAVLALGVPLYFLGPWTRKKTAHYL